MCWRRFISAAGNKANGAWEEQFIEDMLQKYEKWGMDLFLSLRQQEILEKIANR
jgi:hypothetical protein